MSKPYHDEDTLRSDIRELGTQTAVAEKYGVSQATIGYFVRKYEIEQDDWAYDHWNEKDTPWRDEETLRKACRESDSVTEVSEKLNGERETISRWMDKHEIDIEFWGDGGKYTSPYPGNWRNIAKRARERDEECLRCGINPDRTLSVHHIIPVRAFDDPENAHFLENLITLCRSCHRKVEHIPEAKQREILQ